MQTSLIATITCDSQSFPLVIHSFIGSFMAIFDDDVLINIGQLWFDYDWVRINSRVAGECWNRNRITFDLCYVNIYCFISFVGDS